MMHIKLIYLHNNINIHIPHIRCKNKHFITYYLLLRIYFHNPCDAATIPYVWGVTPHADGSYAAYKKYDLNKNLRVVLVIKWEFGRGLSNLNSFSE